MKTIFFDIDTQLDFVFPAGALYAPGAESILHNVAALNHRAPIVISTMDAHAEDDVEFREWPHHCVAGCLGQRKPAATLLEKPIVVPNRACEISISGARQIIVEKQTVDCFTNVHLNAILSHFHADRYVVYGVVTEICVRLAAFGLLKTGKRVEVVTDAIRSLNSEAGARMLAEFQAAGGILTTASEV
jgi:nicotinamidase/pyrazinamidase